MAVKDFTDPETGRRYYYGLSTDTKPPAIPGSRFWEQDTGNKFECYGESVWYRIGTDGFFHVNTLERSHLQVHEGILYTASILADIAGTSSADHLIQVPSGTTLHMSVAAKGAGTLDFLGYAGTTFSAAGTDMTLINNNFNFDTSAVTSSFTSGPTITSPGTLGYSDLMPGGTGMNAAGGSVGAPKGGAEFVLNGGANFLIRLTNNAGSTTRYSLIIVFYEVVT